MRVGDEHEYGPAEIILLTAVNIIRKIPFSGDHRNVSVERPVGLHQLLAGAALSGFHVTTMNNVSKCT